MICEMTPEQEKKLEEWQNAIEKVYGEKGQFEFRFKPIDGGFIFTVFSTLANFELDLTDF